MSAAPHPRHPERSEGSSLHNPDLSASGKMLRYAQHDGDGATPLAAALADAARLAAICEQHGIVVVQAVPRGAAARADTVLIATYTEVCFDNMDLRRQNAALRARLAALEPDEDPEFPAETEGAPV